MFYQSTWFTTSTVIIKGKKSINDVPDKIRDEVKQVLIDEGHPELAEGGN